MYFTGFFVGVYIFYLQTKYAFISSVMSVSHRLLSIHNPLHVYKVVKYNLGTDEETDMTKEYSKGVCFNLKDSDYLEFRVFWLSQQYRYIVNDSKFPSYSDFCDKKGTHIVYAVLVNTREFVYTDVMDRVQKFIGCSKKPFFGKRIICRQLFINDDLTEDHELHIITKDGRLLQLSVDELIDLNK
jgi:hypothetical protein